MRPDGVERWIGTRGHHDGGPDADGRRWSGASVDITDRKRGEERLLESESRFRTVADSAPVLIWMAGPDKRRTFFNRPWLEFTGRTVEQEMGDGWARRRALPTIGRAVSRPMPRPSARAARSSCEYRLRRHDGEYRWIADHGVPRHDAEGTFTGYIGSCFGHHRAPARRGEVPSGIRSGAQRHGHGRGKWPDRAGQRRSGEALRLHAGRARRRTHRDAGARASPPRSLHLAEGVRGQAGSAGHGIGSPSVRAPQGRERGRRRDRPQSDHHRGRPAGRGLRSSTSPSGAARRWRRRACGRTWPTSHASRPWAS